MVVLMIVWMNWIIMTNEVIAELFHRAGGSIRTVNGADWHYTDEGFDMEKFAELLIKECIGLVAPTSHHEAFAQSYMGGVDGLNLLYGKVKKIKEHFGVK